MSAQRTKQSLDSHHSVVNQSETPSADEFYVTDNTNVPKPEGDKEPLSVLSSPHNSQPETQHLTTANRRKLGSRRRNKQQQHVKDSATELHHKPRQKLEESTTGNEDLEITQPEGQEELNSQGSKHNSSVKHDSSLCSSTTSGYSCEVQKISENQQADKDEKPSYSYGLLETMLEVTSASAILQSEEVKENIASSSDFISSLSVRENEKRGVEDTDLSRQDGNVEGNCLKGESHVESVDTGCSMRPEVTTDKNSPRLFTEFADDNQNEHLSLHLDSQLQDSSASTKEQTDTDLTSVNRRKLGSTRRNKRRQHGKDSAAESEEEPVESVRGFDASETAIFPSLTETELKSVEMTLEGTNGSDTDEIEEKEVAHVGVSELNSSDFLPTPSVSEPVINQSDVRKMPHELSIVYAVTNAEGKEKDDDTDLLMQRGSLHASDSVNESHVKSDYLECPKLETSTEKDHGEHTEPECCVEFVIDSSPNEEVSTNEEQNEHFSLSEVRGAQNLDEEAESAEMQEIHLIDHSFESANSEICFANLTDQAEVSESSQFDSSVKGVADSATEQEVSKPDHRQDEHPEKQSNVEAFKQINEDDQVYDPENPETSDIERLDTAAGQVFENERQLEEDIKPSKEQTSHQEKEGHPTDVTESKSLLETTESETHAPFDSEPQDTSVIIDDQSNTDFNAIRNRRKMGSRRRNKRQKSVESPGAESEMSLMPETEVQVGISMQMMLEGMDKVGPSQTEEVSEGNNESAQSSNSRLTSVNVHSSPSVEIQVTEPPNSPASAYSAETDTESKEKDEDTDLLTRWGILQPLNSVNDTHVISDSVESSGKPEITTERSEYREHTEPKYGVEQAAVSSPEEEVSTTEGQDEYFSSFEDRSGRDVHEEEVKPIHMQTMHHIDNSPLEETKPCLQTLESETKLHLDSQPVDNSVSINEETHLGFKLTGNRRKLGSSRKLKGRRHGPEITEPEEQVVENTQSDEVSEKENMPIATGTISQEALKEQTSPDLKLIKKMKSAVEEQENTEQMPEEGTRLLQNVMDNRTVTTDILESTEEVNEAEKKFIKEPEYLTPLPVYDVVKMELIQSVEASVWKDNSDSLNISNHEGNVSPQSIPSDRLDQEETSQIQKTESLPCDKDSVGQEICVQQTTNVTESEVDVVVIEEESLMGAQGSGEVDVEDELKDPANKDHSAQETNTLIEVTHDEPFPVAENKMETFEMGHEENSRAEPDEKSGISTSEDTSNSQGEKDNNDKMETRNMDEDAINTDSGIIEATQHEKQSPEGIKVGLMQDQPLKSVEAASVLVADQEMEDSVIQESNNAPEEAHKTNFEMKDSSPHVSSPNRRKKMGSTRRNLGSRPKIENSHQKQTHVKPDSVESSGKPEITTEKSEYREHTEPKYGVEQAAVSSPEEEVSTTEGQDEYFSSFEDRSGRDVHEEEVKPITMQTMHHIDNSPLEETKPCLQTLESETKLHLDSQPVDNSVSVNEEPHSGFKLTGNRRKLGSSRRLKGRRHGPEITEPEEQVVENTQSDEVSEKENIPIATGTISQEELKEQTSPDLKLINKMKSAVEEQENTEQMPEEGTRLLQNLMDNRTTVTTDILESTEEVNEAEKNFIKEPEYLIPLPVYDVVKMELIQSVEASVWKDNSDSLNMSNHEGNVSTQSIPSDRLDQEETSQIQKTESLPCDKDSVGQEICVQQKTNVNESEVDVVVVEEESLMGAQGSGEDDVEDELKDPANKDHSAQETNTLIEVTHDEPFPVAENKMEAFEMGHEENSRAEPDEKSGISTSEDTSNSQGEKDNNDKMETRNMDEDTINTDSGIIEATQNEKQSPEGIKVGLMQDQPLKSVEVPSVLVADQEMEDSVIQESNNAPEEAHKTNFEMKDSSPHVSSPNRRRKMGSTRRNLGSRPKIENSHQKQTHVKPDSVESSGKPEITTEKSEYREHTEPKYGVEQAAVSSPEEEVSTTEGQDEYFSSFEDRSGRDVHEEEVKPIHMQTMHHIDNSPLEETKPCLQTLESETKLHLDSQPVDNSVSVNEETHSGFKLTGNRRKLGSSRKLKGRRHGPEITEPEEEVVENTQSDEVSEKENMPIATGTISQEALKEQTSPDLKLIKKMKSAVEEQENTEQMPEEGTRLLQNLMDNRTTVTTDILESTEEVNEAEKNFIKEPEYLTPPPVYDVVKMELIQSVEASVWKDNSDSLNISNHEGNVSTQSIPSDRLDQEETSQIQKTESLPCDKDSVGQEICVQQKNNVNESEVDVVVIEAERLMGAQGSGEVDVEDELKDPANKDHSAQETNTLIEVTHDEPFPVAENKMEAFEMGHEENSRAEPDEKSEISTSEDTSNSQGEKDNNDKTETRSMDEDAINTDSGIIEATQNEKQSPEGIKVGLMQDQPLKSVEVPSVLVADQEMEDSVIQESNNAPEEAHKTNFEMKDSSPHVSSPNRRRKMGSTRRNLGSRPKIENSHQKQTHVKPDSVESSGKPEITTEKSEYREHTEPKYGVEQAAVSSPEEEVSTTEGQDEYFSSFEDRSGRDVHEEEVKPITMQTMHHIDNSPLEETKPCLQTLESETKLHLDSQPVDNSVSINEETHLGFKLTGNRRKLGSSRKLKGRRHGPEITEPEEQVVENTQSDEVSEKENMPIATGTISQEELKEQTSPDLKLIKKMKSAVEEQENTEQMPEEGTRLLQNVMDNRTVTTDILESTEEVNEAEKKFIKEPEYLTPLPVYDVVKMELIQSVEASVWKDNSDSLNISNHEGNVSPQSVPSDRLDQEETSQIQKTESLPCDKDSVGQEICVQQTTNVNESEVDVVVIEAESLMGAQGSGEVDVEDELKDPANKDHSAQETNTLIEVTHDEPFPVAEIKMEAFEMGHEENSRAEPDEKSGISTSEDTSNSQGEKDNNDKTETRNMDEDAINTDSGIIEATQNEKQSPEGIKVGLMQDQPLKSVEAPSVLVADQETEDSVIQESNNAPEEAHKTNFEMKDSSPHVSSPNRRRKMGSTRRNLGSRPKIENSHQKQTHVKPDSVESSGKPEITTEKSEYREHTEPKYGVEQAAVSSPTEEVSTTEGQDEYFSSFEDRSGRDVHEEEVKPIHMQTMHHIDNSPLEETKPCLQTLESETKLHLDSQPVDNSVSVNEETHLGFKLTGNRRKLGSSRKLKGRRHGPEITEPEEEVVENTQSDEVSEKENMPIATGTISQEELKEQTSPDLKLIKKMKSAVEEQENTEQMPEEGTRLLQNLMDNRTTVTTDILESTEEVNEAEKKFIKEPEYLTPLPVYDVVKMELIQSVEASVWKDNSDSLNISNHEGNVSTQSVPSDRLDQEETSQIQKTESLPCDKDSVGQEICVQQKNNVNESEVDVVVIEAESLMGAQGSGEVDVEDELKDPANKDHSAQETNTLIEVTHDEPFPVAENKMEVFEMGHEENSRAEPDEKSEISTSEDTSNSQGEKDNNDKTETRSMDEDAINTDSGIIEATQNEKQSPEGIKVGLMQDQPLKSVTAPSVLVADQEMEDSVIQESNNAPEEAHKTSFEMKDSSPHISSPNRRRKMGSTRRNLGSRPKIENSHQKQTHVKPDSVESSGKPEITTEKSENREHTEPKYGVEQAAVSSPEEEVSTTEGQDEYFSSFEDRSGRDVHEEEVKPIHMQTMMHHIDNSPLEETKPCLQTLESETKLHLDSQPVDNSVSINEETHLGFKLTGNRRKLGSSRRLKGRRHGPEITEPEEQVVENTQSDEVSEKENMPIATGTISQEELKEQTSPDLKLIEKMKSAVGDSGIIEATQNEKQSPEGIKVGLMQDQPLKSVEVPSVLVADQEMEKSVIQESNNAPEEAHKTNFEMKDSSPHVSSPNRRRKMGSTRRNLGSRHKVENSHQKEDKEELNVESVSVIIEKDPSIIDQKENSDSEQREEKMFETVELSQTGESQLNSPAQQTVEENPDFLSQQVETEHHLTPAYLPAKRSPPQKQDVMSESAAGGRRRKMGSHRKSHGHQKNEDRMMSAQKERDVRSLTDESVNKTSREEREESLGLNEKSEVEECVKTLSSNISVSNVPELSRPLSRKAPERETPVQQHYTEFRPRQEGQNTFSLAGDSRGADIRSKSYNVLLVGNSSVGKTSLMKRALSGKFSYDVPASVGLDYCMWTVVVDGKPVVLQLWDSAGQERFHSITRQVFHKAQAFLLMYDITSSQSFSAISYWANCIQEGATEDVTILLLGNKSDCVERKVKTEEGEILAKEYNFEFMECSAATGENVIHSLETVARMLSEKYDTSEETVELHKKPPQKTRSGCC